MDSKFTTSIKSHNRTNNTTRQFSGPSDKKQHYIGEFLSQISKSDPHSRHFSKVELMDANNALRKAVTSNPHLFRIIQQIVDDCVFVDDEILEMMNSKEQDKLPEISEDTLDRMNNTLEEQNMLKQLCEFNAVQISNRRNLMMNFDDHHDDICKTPRPQSKIKHEIDATPCKTVFKPTGEDFVKTILSNPVDTTAWNLYFKNLRFCLQANFKDFSAFSNRLDDFKFKLMNTDQMIMSVLLSENRSRSCADVIELNQIFKEKYLFLKGFFMHLNSLLMDYEQEISDYNTRKNLESVLRTIECKQDAAYNEAGLTLCKYKDLNSENVRTLLCQYQSISPDQLVSAMHRLENSIIILDNQNRRRDK